MNTFATGITGFLEQSFFYFDLLEPVFVLHCQTKSTVTVQSKFSKITNVSQKNNEELSVEMN